MSTQANNDLSDLRIEASGGVPITRQLVDHIRTRCASGALPAGTRLPSVRELARMLAINQNTVLRAYERLTVDGFIERRHGDGTYVVDRPPSGQLRAQRQLLREDVDRLIYRAAILGISRQQMQALIERAWSEVEIKKGQSSQMENAK